MLVQTHTRTHANTLGHWHIHTHSCSYTWTRTCIQQTNDTLLTLRFVIQTDHHTHAHAQTQTHTYTYTQHNTLTHTHIQYTHTHTHIHTNTHTHTHKHAHTAFAQALLDELPNNTLANLNRFTCIDCVFGSTIEIPQYMFASPMAYVDLSGSGLIGTVPTLYSDMVEFTCDQCGAIFGSLPEIPEELMVL